MTRRLCAACQESVDHWFDYYQAAGPLRRWRQLNSRMDVDVRAARLDERVRLIRAQVALIRSNCLAQHAEVAA